MTYTKADELGFAKALFIARTGTRIFPTATVEKMMGLFLRHGQCDIRMTAKPSYDVRFSWLDKRTPRSYFSADAPGIMSQFMYLGKRDSINDEAIFTIGPGEMGRDICHFEFDKKWVKVQCAPEHIIIRTREHPTDLDAPLPTRFCKDIW